MRGTVRASVSGNCQVTGERKYICRTGSRLLFDGQVFDLFRVYPLKSLIFARVPPLSLPLPHIFLSQSRLMGIPERRVSIAEGLFVFSF